MKCSSPICTGRTLFWVVPVIGRELVFVDRGVARGVARRDNAMLMRSACGCRKHAIELPRERAVTLSEITSEYQRSMAHAS
jgi:hypothetical protein